MEFKNVMSLTKTIFALCFGGFGVIYGSITGKIDLVYIGTGILVTYLGVEAIDRFGTRKENGTLQKKLNEQ